MAALRAAVFPLSAKNRRGGHFLPPPSSARVKMKRNSNSYISSLDIQLSSFPILIINAIL